MTGPKSPPAPPPKFYERPTPKVKRLKKAKVFTAAERTAFLAGRPDLKMPGKDK